MYDIKDRKSAVNRIKRIFNLSENGIYDEIVKNEVLNHQKNHSLPTTGVVDFYTFNSLMKENEKLKTSYNIRALIPMLKEYPYIYGDIGNDMITINSILANAIELLHLDIQKPKGSFFGNNTVAAVQHLSRIMLLNNEDFIDEIFLDRVLKFK